MPFLPSVCEENLETAILKLISRRTVYNNDTGGITIGSTILKYIHGTARSHHTVVSFDHSKYHTVFNIVCNIFIEAVNCYFLKSWELRRDKNQL